MAFYREKIEIAFDMLEKHNIDMWIVAGQESATCSEPVLDVMSDVEFIGCTALIFNKDRTCATVCTPIDKNGYIHAGVFDEVIDFPVSFEQSVGEYIAKKKPNVIALDYSINNVASDGLSYGMYRTLLEAFEIAGFNGETVSAEPIINQVRGVKLPHELAAIRKACEITEEIFTLAKDVIKEGANCIDVYNFFQSEVKRRGLEYSWPSSCNPGVFAGYNCPSGHMGAPDRVIKKGDLINVDFGIIVDGYSSDMQRMYYLLKDDETDAPEDIKQAFYVLRDGVKKAADFMKPGVTGFEVDKVARDYITSFGFPGWGHALGHQLGRVAHDGGPVLAPERPRYNRPELIHSPLSEGFVFTLEPGIPTRCGNMAIEEDVVITKDGAQFMVPPQQELILVRG